MAEVLDFLEKHKEREVSAICERINYDFGWEESPAWKKAVERYAEEIYRDRMSRRKK